MRALSSRRAFLRNSYLAASYLALGSGLSSIAKAVSRPLAAGAGLQLYTLWKECNADLSGTLSSIAAMGYRTVESAGLSGKTVKEFRAALDAAELKCPSSHLFLKPDRSDLSEFLETVQGLGSQYAVTSFIYPGEMNLKSAEDYIKAIAAFTADDYKRSADLVNQTAARAKSFGLKLLYHNHNIEFARLANDLTGYDVLVASTDPSLVSLELDCGWCDLGGSPPIPLLKRYAGRFRMLHIKDFVRVAHPVVGPADQAHIEWTKLGEGHLDYRQILAAAPQAGVEQIFVEQEPPYLKFTALEAAKANLLYLRSIA